MYISFTFGHDRKIGRKVIGDEMKLRTVRNNEVLSLFNEYVLGGEAPLRKSQRARLSLPELIIRNVDNGDKARVLSR